MVNFCDAICNGCLRCCRYCWLCWCSRHSWWMTFTPNLTCPDDCNDCLDQACYCRRCCNKPFVFFIYFAVVCALVPLSVIAFAYLLFGGVPPLYHLVNASEILYWVGLIGVVGGIFAIFYLKFQCTNLCFSIPLELAFIYVISNAIIATVILGNFTEYNIYKNQDLFTEHMELYSNHFYEKYGYPPPFLEFVQRREDCCGIYNYTTYNIPSRTKFNKIPRSCCKRKNYKGIDFDLEDWEWWKKTFKDTRKYQRGIRDGNLGKCRYDSLDPCKEPNSEKCQQWKALQEERRKQGGKKKKKKKKKGKKKKKKKRRTTKRPDGPPVDPLPEVRSFRLGHNQNKTYGTNRKNETIFIGNTTFDIKELIKEIEIKEKMVEFEIRVKRNIVKRQGSDALYPGSGGESILPSVRDTNLNNTNITEGCDAVILDKMDDHPLLRGLGQFLFWSAMTVSIVYFIAWIVFNYYYIRYMKKYLKVRHEPTTELTYDRKKPNAPETHEDRRHYGILRGRVNKQSKYYTGNREIHFYFEKMHNV